MCDDHGQYSRYFTSRGVCERKEKSKSSQNIFRADIHASLTFHARF